MNEINYHPIGIIHSSFTEAKGTPIQASAASESKGTIELYPTYSKGLTDLDGFSHIILLYHFHRSTPSSLLVKPFMDDTSHGVFAMRGPSRPNPIGLSVVKLLDIKENILSITDVDIIDSTPLLDIKPFVPAFDHRTVKRIGWLTGHVQKLAGTTDDGRFEQ